MSVSRSQQLLTFFCCHFPLTNTLFSSKTSHSQEWRSATTDTEVAFPGKLTLLGALPFRFLSVEENRTIMVAYGEKNGKAPWNPGEKGTLIIVKHRNNNFYNNGEKNIGVLLCYFKHCENKYNCWWMSKTFGLRAASMWCLGISAVFNIP